MDALNFLRRFLFWEHEKKGEVQPYEVVSSQTGRRGRLRQLRRGVDCPRDVATWEFAPYKTKHEFRPPALYHFYCDHLEKIDGDRSGWRRGRATHKIQIFRVRPTRQSNGTYSYISAGGSYLTQILYDGEHRLHVHSNKRDEYAIPVMRCIANLLLFRPVRDHEWGEMIDSCAKEHLGGNWSPVVRVEHESLEEGSVEVLRYDPAPVDPAELLKGRSKPKRTRKNGKGLSNQ